MISSDIVKGIARKIVEYGQEHDIIAVIEGAEGLVICKIIVNDKSVFSSAFTNLLREKGASRPLKEDNRST